MDGLLAYNPPLAAAKEVVNPMALVEALDFAFPANDEGALSTVVDFERVAAQAKERINRVRHAAMEYMACGWNLCPIAIGSKGPKTKDWQHKPLELSAIGNHGLGLIHALSGTCVLDVDDLVGAEAWLAARGVDLRDLLVADDAVQISSGRPNRAKLLYRVPLGVQRLATKKIEIGGATILEFRCAASDGAGCQDVLPPTIHPKTRVEYKWAGAGDFTNLPVLPDALLKVWPNAMASPEVSLATVVSDASCEIIEGARNQTLFKIAGDLVGAGMAKESVLAALLKENEIRCVEPLPASEVEAIVRSAHKSSRGAVRLAHQEGLHAAARAAADAALVTQFQKVTAANLVERLPPVMQRLVAWYEQCAFMPQEEFKLAIALASCGSVLARDFVSENETSTNMYWVLIAPTATGKEAALRCVTEVLTVYGDSRHAGSPSSEGGVLAALERNAASSFVIDEMGEFLKGVFDPKAAGYKAATGMVLMDLYTKGGTEYLGREYSKQTGRDARKRADIDSPCPSIFGATTPSTFYGALSAGVINSGFLPRMLTVRAPDVVPEANWDQRKETLPATVSDWLEAVKLRIGQHQKEVGAGGNLRGVQSYRPVRVPFSEGAKELRKAEMAKIRDRRNSGIDELASNMISRIVENASRVALILALSADPQAVEVEVEHLQLALQIVHQATDVFAADVRKNLFDSKFAELEAKVLDYVKKFYLEENCAVTEGILADRCRLYSSATQGQRKAVMEALEGQGKITRTAGRNKGSWRFSPTPQAFQ